MKLPPAVIPLPWRLPKTAATPHLPPDVLFSIATYLSFSDRLNLALSSRYVHSVVLFITELICLRTKQIWKLHAYLHGDLKTRAPCLVSLSLHFQDLYDWSDAFSLEETYEIVLTILRVATNLRHISTDNDWQWNATSTQAPVHRVLEVMGGMPHLQSLLINAPAHKVLLSPSLFAVSLKKLHIRSYRGPGNLSFPHFCRSLTHLPSLESLTLEFFPAKCFAKLNTQGRLPALQSIRNLELIQTWLPYHTHRHLPTIFPNLHTLQLIHCHLRTGQRERHSFPSLKHVVLLHIRRHLTEITYVPYPVDSVRLVMLDEYHYCRFHCCSPYSLAGLALRAPLSVWRQEALCKDYRWLELETPEDDIAYTLSDLVRFPCPRYGIPPNADFLSS